MTRLITASQLVDILDVDAAISTLRDGFIRDNDSTIRGQRARTDLPGPGTATALLPGLIPGIDAFTMKMNAKFPAASPALRGVIGLFDLNDGTLLALLDSATITAWRTGLAAALATDTLASQLTSATVGVIGAGAQAALMVRGLAHLRKIDHLVVTDTNPEAASAFGADNAPAGVTVEIVDSAEAVAAKANIVLLATWPKSPLLNRSDVQTGQHLTSLGADEPGKAELSTDLFFGCSVFVDDLELVREVGALGTAGVDIDAPTLGQVLRNERDGRMTPEEITIYTPVGLPWQDLALAWTAYRAAEKNGIGIVMDLLS